MLATPGEKPNSTNLVTIGTPIADEEDPELAHALALSREQLELEQREIWTDLSTTGHGGGSSKSTSTTVHDVDSSRGEEDVGGPVDISHSSRKTPITYSSRKRARDSSAPSVVDKPASKAQGATEANKALQKPANAIAKDVSPPVAKPSPVIIHDAPTPKPTIGQSTTPATASKPKALNDDDGTPVGDDLLVTAVKSATPTRHRHNTQQNKKTKDCIIVETEQHM